MNKIFKTGLAVALTTSLLMPINVFAVDAKSYADKFKNMDFQSMMKNTSEESLEGYFNDYNKTLNSVDKTYEGKYQGIEANLQKHSIIYQDDKGNMQIEFASDEKELNSKYSSLKSKLNADLKKQVNTEEKNYDKKDSINAKLFEAEKRASDGKHTSKYLSYKSSASKTANNKYNRVEGSFSSLAGGIKGKYNPNKFASSVSDLKSKVQASGYSAVKSDKFDGFGSELASEIKSKYEQGLATSADIKKQAAEEAKRGQITKENAKNLRVPITPSVARDLEKVNAYAERVEMRAADPINDLKKLKKELGLENEPEELVQIIAGNHAAAKISGDKKSGKSYLPENLRRTSSFNVIMNLGEKQGDDQYKKFKSVKKGLESQKEQMEGAIRRGDCAVSFKQGDIACRAYAGDTQVLDMLNKDAQNVGLGKDYFSDLKGK